MSTYTKNRFINVNFDEKEVLKKLGDLSDLEKEIINIIEEATTLFISAAKIKITQKGHIITGTLRRSIRYITTSITDDIIKGKLGSHVHYAYWVENLPDGGYLLESFNEKFDTVANYIRGRLKKLLYTI